MPTKFNMQGVQILDTMKEGITIKATPPNIAFHFTKHSYPSLASQTLTLHSILVLSGGGRVWPTAYACLDPARQDIVWPITFMEDMITSR